MASLYEHPINLLEPYISSITDDNTKEYITEVAIAVQNEYNDLGHRLESKTNKQMREIFDLKKDNMTLRCEINNWKDKHLKLEQKFVHLEHKFEQQTQQINQLNHEKDMIFYRQIIVEIYNIAI